MESIDAITGSVLDMRKRQYGEVKKGYTYFEEGDILFAKITPCMQNGKHFIARNLIDGFGFGTTEFHVIRAGSEIVSELVWHFLRQPQLLIAAKEHFTGAVGQQRLPEDYIRALQFSLPPLAEQERIAAKLREQMAAVEQARAAAEAELATINALPAALLRRAFSGQL
jgi:type I restriction enzyme S subunit